MPDTPTTLRDELLGIARRADSALSPQEFAEQATTPNDGYVRAELSRMAAEGLLVKPRRGRYELPEQNAHGEEDDPEDDRSLTTRRPHVHLDDSAPRPDPHRLLVARIYNSFGEFVGFRYAVTDLQRVPYEIVLHADGTEEVRQPEPVNREAA